MEKDNYPSTDSLWEELIQQSLSIQNPCYLYYGLIKSDWRRGDGHWYCLTKMSKKTNKIVAIRLCYIS